MDSTQTLPPAPLTLEGASILHQMMRVRWAAWRALPLRDRAGILDCATRALSEMEAAGSAVFSMFGHKGDLMLVHFRPDFAALSEAERALPRLRLWDFLEQTTSYLSVVELGLYDSTLKAYTSLAEHNIAPYSIEWNEQIEQTLSRQRAAMRPRLFPEMPAHPYICFYPMNRLRGEQKNWYRLPIEERQREMADHGAIGRRYAGTVKQIISGSIGFDDWEWGVDLFAEDPLVFKRLIYEMRFDEASATYALFGAFYVGRRTAAADLEKLLAI